MPRKSIAKTGRKVSRRNERPEPMEDMSMDQGVASRSVNRFQERFSGVEGRDLKGWVSELASNPTVRYIAGGLAAAVLTRIATNLSDRYPELSNFIKENVDNFEGRLGGMRDNLGDSARH